MSEKKKSQTGKKPEGEEYIVFVRFTAEYDILVCAVIDYIDLRLSPNLQLLSTRLYM